MIGGESNQALSYSWTCVQATSRAYRYGQTREVFIYRLVSSDTPEDCMYKRQVCGSRVCVDLCVLVCVLG